MKAENGKTQKASRRFNACSSKDKSEGLGSFRGSSEVNGVESVGVNKADSPRQSVSGRVTRRRESFTGKILERLNLIEDAFLSYIRGDQEYLQGRLDKSRKQEENFLGIIGHLKQEVYDFVSSDDKDEISK